MRKHKIEDQQVIDEIIRKAEVCTMSMVDGDSPYAVPMNFGYVNGEIILHTAPVGKKLEVLKKNPKVCLSFYVDEKLNIRHEKVACSYSMKFRSVLAFGEVETIEDIEEKTKAMNEVMKQYTGKNDFSYNEPAIRGVHLMKVKVKEFTAFNRGYDE